MSDRRGLTLIEMMVAILVTSLLVTAAVQVYRGVVSVQQRATAPLARDRYAEVFFDRLERELGGTLLVKKREGDDRLAHPYLFVGDDRMQSDADVDALRFVTQSPSRAASDPLGSGLRMVSYAVVTQAEGGLALVRQEEALPDGMEKEIQLVDPQPVFADVATFRVRYLDELTGEWVEAWDSTDVALIDRLPLEVEVALALEEPDETGELAVGMEHSRRIALPVREIDLDAMRAAAFGEQDEQQCVTVAECIGHFQALLAEASSATAEAIQEALATSADACWDENGELADRIRAMGGDTAAECKK
jgi:type II secretion system protein J